jgi:hypothetical protein
MRAEKCFRALQEFMVMGDAEEDLLESERWSERLGLGSGPTLTLLRVVAIIEHHGIPRTFLGTTTMIFPSTRSKIASRLAGVVCGKRPLSSTPRRKSHYETLGIPNDASKAQIKVRILLNIVRIVLTME